MLLETVERMRTRTRGLAVVQTSTGLHQSCRGACSGVCTMEQQQQQPSSGGSTRVPVVAPAGTKLRTFGWAWDPQLPDDDNFMTLCMVVTRSSFCIGGQMGCAAGAHAAAALCSRGSAASQLHCRRLAQ